jgi:hypothetical protein
MEIVKEMQKGFNYATAFGNKNPDIGLVTFYLLLQLFFIAAFASSEPKSSALFRSKHPS